MNPPTIAGNENEDSFVVLAIRNGLLRADRAPEVLQHAQKQKIPASDAALNLAVMEMYEIDAINLLRDPTNLAPGYEITQLIGCGANGMVFRAKQSALDRDVALKTINIRAKTAESTSKPRIQREAKAIARFQHPNIVSAYDSGFYKGRFCIAMEFVEGETLATYIGRKSALAETTTWLIARQVAAALAHALEFGVIHRDIKPANLLIANKHASLDLEPNVPMIKVADFGLALDRADTEDQNLTATGTTLGTPAYVAPEQLQDTKVDQRADIYSLGATVYHMLAGSAPCANRSPMKTIIRKTIGDEGWREELPETVSPVSRELFLAMTHAELDDRIGSYDQLLTRIDQVIEKLRHGDAGNTETMIELDGSSRFAVPGKIRADQEDTLSLDLALRIKRNTLYLGVLSLLIVIVVGFAAYWSNRTETLVLGPRWRTTGINQPLFNGQSVPLFRQFGGATGWKLGNAADGSRVFYAGKGAAMTIPMYDRQSEDINVRLRIGVNLEPDSIAELFIGSHDGTAGQTGIIRLTDRQASFHRADSPVADSSAARRLRSIGLPIAKPDETIFQLVQIFRQGARVLIDVNGDDLGVINCDRETEIDLMIRCAQGTVNFADFDIVGLIDPEAETGQAGP